MSKMANRYITPYDVKERMASQLIIMGAMDYTPTKMSVGDEDIFVFFLVEYYGGSNHVVVMHYDRYSDVISVFNKTQTFKYEKESSKKETGNTAA